MRGGEAGRAKRQWGGSRGEGSKAAKPATSRQATKQGTGVGHQRERGRSAATAVQYLRTRKRRRGATTMFLRPWRTCRVGQAGSAQICQHRAAHSPTAASAPTHNTRRRTSPASSSSSSKKARVESKAARGKGGLPKGRRDEQREPRPGQWAGRWIRKTEACASK